MSFYKTITGTAKNDVINGTKYSDYIDGKAGNDVIHGNAGNDRILGGSYNDRLYGDSGNDALYGGTGNDVLLGGTGHNTLAGGLGADSYYLAAGISNADTIKISQSDSSLNLIHMKQTILSGTVKGIDTIYNFDKYDKIDLKTNGIAANANVNTVNDTAHFKNYSIKDGILTLKNGATDVNINSTSLVKEAFLYAMKNLNALPHDEALGIKVNVDGHAHTLIMVNHSEPGVTMVDVVGTLNALTSDQIF